ncbi:MAG: GNAT family N-acetyltransferase [Pseudomonadota bacterium]
MAMQDQYALLTSSNDASFEEFYSIYFSSMPAREQKSRALLAAMAARADYRILLVIRKAAVIGFSVVFAPPEESFRLLEYMAVHAEHRNAGVGGRLFLRSVQDAVNGRGNIPVLLEVDSDREFSADQAIRKRRRQFYKRLGCCRIEGLSYILPLPGKGAPPQMDLMIYFPEGVSPVGKPYLERWLKAIYQGVYNCSSDDPRIAQMMRTVTDPVTFA